MIRLFSRSHSGRHRTYWDGGKAHDAHESQANVSSKRSHCGVFIADSEIEKTT